MKVLFWQQGRTKCGIHQTGLQIASVLGDLGKSCAVKVVSSDDAGLYRDTCRAFRPDCVVGNFHHAVQPWWFDGTTPHWPVPHALIWHEITQEIANQLPNLPRVTWLSIDPTIPERPGLKNVGRILERHRSPVRSRGDRLVVSSFGFGFQHKGFEDVATTVAQQLPGSILRLHCTASDYGDPLNQQSLERFRSCREILRDADVELRTSTNFMPVPDLLRWLDDSDLNVFLYRHTQFLGVSGALDWALSVQRPIAINRCPMFRHLHDATPSCCVEDRPLQSIMDDTTDPFGPHRALWSHEAAKDRYGRLLEELA